MEQISLFDYAPEVMPPPEWEKCFDTCRHFDSHPDYKPDCFPGYPNHKRCSYCDHEGTSGKQFKLKCINNIWHMWCKYYEYGGKHGT